MKQLPTNFLIRVYDQKTSELVQNKLFELGTVWNVGSEKSFKKRVIESYPSNATIHVQDGIMMYSPLTYYKNSPKTKNLPIITIDDLFSTTVIKPLKVNSLSHKLEKQADGSLKVGCQHVSAADVKLIMEYLKGE